MNRILSLGCSTYAELVHMEINWLPGDSVSPVIRSIKAEIAKRDSEFIELQHEATYIWQRSNRKFYPLPNDHDIIKFNRWNSNENQAPPQGTTRNQFRVF